MRNKTLVIFLTLSTFRIAFGNNIEIVVDNLENYTNGFRSLGAGEKQLLDTAYLDLFDATQIEFQITPYSERTLFNTVPGILPIEGFFHGSNGGKTLNLYENPETKAIVGSMIDSDTNEIHQISTNYKGETEVVTRNSTEFIDGEDEMVIPKSKFGFFGNRNLDESPMLRSGSVSNTRSLLYKVYDTSGIIDVMVVWTKMAECQNSGLPTGCKRTSQTKTNMLDKINLAVDETNTAFALSGIDAQIRLVHAYSDNTYCETGILRTLNDVTYKDDGFMDDVHENRIAF